MTQRVVLSAFGDEAAADLSEQMDILERCGIRHIELRGVWGKNIATLTDAEVTRVHTEMGARGFGISAIGSPIGKVGIGDDWPAHLQVYRRVIEIARQLETRYIRIFSFFMPEGQPPASYRDTVMERMSQMASLAGEAGLVAVHENERDIYGDTPERCADIIRTVNSPYLRAVFDPANFVVCGVKPLTEALPLLQEYVEYVHVKDALAGSGKIVPAGLGDGGLRETLQSLVERGFCGFLTLEPHLAMVGTFAGFSGPELFATAASALKTLLDDLGIEYN